MLMEL